MRNYWNYRVMAKEYKGETWFDIHEIYYKNDIPVSYSEDPAIIGGDSLNDINNVLSLMTECLKKPILWYGEKFPEEYKESKSILTSLLEEIEEDRKKHSLKYKFDIIKYELWCFITNNKFIKWIQYKFKK